MWIRPSGSRSSHEGTGHLSLRFRHGARSRTALLVIAVTFCGLVLPEARAADGTLSGTVTEAGTGAALGGVTLRAFCWQVEGSNAGDVCGETQTAADGTHALQLAPGTYKVLFDNWPSHAAQYYGGGGDLGDEDALEVRVPDGGAVAGIDAVLVPLRALAGTTTGDGLPVSGIHVTAYQRSGGVVPTWESVQGTETRPDGSYALHLPDGTYRVGFTDAHGPYQAEFFEDAETVDQADDVVLAGADVGGVDADLARNHPITGTVIVDGIDMPGVAVVAWQQVSHAAGWEAVKWTTTGSQGTYALYLPDGTYRVEFATWQARFDPVYFDGASSLGLADDIVIDGAAAPDVNAAIVSEDVASGPAITGTVTVVGTGAAAEGVTVTAWRWNTSTSAWEPVKEASAGPDGTYALFAPEGTYRVGFGGASGRYQPAFYDGAERVEDAADVIVTTEGAPGVDAQLLENASISGVVTADPVPDGPPGPPPTAVTAWRRSASTGAWEPVHEAFAGPDGRYVLYVPDSSYRIGFVPHLDGYQPVYYDGAGTIDDADDVVVAGERVTDIDAHLSIGTPDPGDEWPRAVTLSQAGQDAWDPQVAVGPDGVSAAVWHRRDTHHTRVQVTTRAAAGSWSSPTTLSAAGEDAWDPQVAVGARGRAVVVWRQWAGSGYQVQAATRAPNGSWSSPIALSDADEDAWDPRVAVGARGRAVVVWRRLDGTGFQVRAATRTGYGRWSSPTTLSEAGEDAWDAQVAVGSGGTAVTVWSRSDGVRHRVQATTRAGHGRWSAPVTLSEAGADAWNPQVAVGSDGATVVWHRWDDNGDRIQAVSRAQGAAAWTVPESLSAAGHDAHDPQVTVDHAGLATAVWSWWDGTNSRVQAASRAGRGPWTTPMTLSTAGRAAQDPVVAAGVDGRAVAVWHHSDGSGDWVEATIRRPDGSWPATTRLVEGGPRAFGPRVAAGADGTVAAVWERHDGVHDRVQAAVLSPLRGDRPPRPPRGLGGGDHGGT